MALAFPLHRCAARQMTTRRAALCVAVAALLGACRTTADVPVDAGLHAPITNVLRGPGRRTGSWRGADAYSTWQVTLDGPHIMQLDEVAISTDSARAMRQAQFDTTGQQTRLREERVLVVYGQRATPDTLRTLIELEWMRDSLVRSSKQVNGVSRLLQPYEVDNLKRHLRDVLALARAGGDATK